MLYMFFLPIKFFLRIKALIKFDNVNNINNDIQILALLKIPIPMVPITNKGFIKWVQQSKFRAFFSLI